MDLERALQKIIDDYFIDLEEDSIFHYTNQEGYDSISRSPYLKLNSHHYLNNKDPANKELEPAINLITENINVSNDLKHILTTFNKFIENGIVYYSASFSTIRSIINRKKYGEYCLEFKTKHLINTVKICKSPTILGKVFYNENDQQKIIQELFSTFHKYADINLKIKQAQLETLIVKLITVIPLFKEQSHRHENEVRIVQVEGYTPDDGKLFSPMPASKRFDFKIEDITVYRD